MRREAPDALGGLCYADQAMAAVCDICGKKPFFGKRVSKSHRRTNRRWDPNIQTVHTLVSGNRKRMHVCASCIKAGKVAKAV